MTIEPAEVERLCERLRESNGARMLGEELYNPDGPEAATALESLLSDLSSAREELERARKVIEPFAEIARKAPPDATDDDFAVVKFFRLRAAAAFLAPEAGRE